MKSLSEVLGLKEGDFYCIGDSVNEVKKGLIAMSFAEPNKVGIVEKGCFPTCANSCWTKTEPYFRCTLFDRRECRFPEHKLFRPNETEVISEYKFWLKQRGVK